VEALSGRGTNANRILQRKTPIDGSSVEAARDAAAAFCRFAKNHSFADDVHEALLQLKSVGYGGLSKTLERLLEKISQPVRTADVALTKAEMDVLQALARGSSPKEIAAASGRSVYTIQVHIQNVIRKLGCSGRNEAMTVARKRGLLA
jgi:DNA-binding NarL/FixJ family response regulator